MIKGVAKGTFTIIVVATLLLIFSFVELMGSIYPQFNLWYFLFATIGIWQFLYLLPWYKKKIKANKRTEGIGLLISSLFGIYILFSNLDYIQSFKRIDLDKFEKTELTFNNLPVPVQDRYELHNYDEYGIFISTDSIYKISTYSSTMDDGFTTLLKEGFKHHFIINDKHFTLQANQGDPFILHNDKFYYCKELNLRKSKVKSSRYFEIDLRNNLKSHQK